MGNPDRSSRSPAAPSRLVLPLAFAIGGLVVGCNKDKTESQGAPPPPPPSASAAPAGACSSGGGAISDPLSAPFFPRTVGAKPAEYCIDPQGDTRTYGEKGKLSMDEVCTT